MSWWKSRSAEAEPPRERLLQIAQTVATERGWPWLEPVEIDLESTSSAGQVWAVRTNCHARGMNIRVVISERKDIEPELTVMSAAFMPR